MDLELNEQTRQGKNICPNCGHPKIMHYRPWCPRCDVYDAMFTMQVVNIIQVLDHFKTLDGDDKWKDAAWDAIIEFCDYPRNGTYHYVHVKDILKRKEEFPSKIWKVFKRITSGFMLEDAVLLQFDW